MSAPIAERIRAPWHSALTRFGRVIWKLAYSAAPGVILDPDQEVAEPRDLAEDDLAYYRERDPKENDESAPIEGEAIDLRLMLGAEFYTPGSFGDLLKAFAKLGWDIDDPRLNRESPSSWIRQLRSNPHAGGTYNLGLLVREKSDSWTHRRVSPLPESVQYAFGRLVGVTSSISAIVLTFVLTEKAARSLDQALREPRVTRRVPLGGTSYSIEQPSHQKRKAIQEVRRALRAEITQWFKSHLPGLFSSGHLGGELPTCEFITLKVGRPFQSGQKNPPEYLSLLGIDHAYDAWKTKGDLYFLPRMRWESPQFHSVSAVCEADLKPDDFKYRGGVNREGIAAHYGEKLNGLVERWSLLALLSGYENYANAIRDSASLRADSGRPSQLMQDLRTFVGRAAEVSFVASELKVLAESERRFGYEFDHFESCDADREKLGLTTLAAALSNTVKWRAERLEASDRTVREIITQYGTVLAAQENYKVQMQVGRLTFGALVFAVLAALFAAENSPLVKCLLKGALTCS